MSAQRLDSVPMPGISTITAARIRQAKAARKDPEQKLLWRLYSGDHPCSKTEEATEDEMMAWNRNSVEFYSWRISLGKLPLPILQWKLESDARSASVFRVHYTEKGLNKMREVVAQDKGDARREFERWAPVMARIKRIEGEES